MRHIREPWGLGGWESPTKAKKHRFGSQWKNGRMECATHTRVLLPVAEGAGDAGASALADELGGNLGVAVLEGPERALERGITRSDGVACALAGKGTGGVVAKVGGAGAQDGVGIGRGARYRAALCKYLGKAIGRV